MALLTRIGGVTEALREDTDDPRVAGDQHTMTSAEVIPGQSYRVMNDADVLSPLGRFKRS